MYYILKLGIDSKRISGVFYDAPAGCGLHQAFQSVSLRQAVEDANWSEPIRVDNQGCSPFTASRFLALDITNILHQNWHATYLTSRKVQAHKFSA